VNYLKRNTWKRNRASKKGRRFSSFDLFVSHLIDGAAKDFHNQHKEVSNHVISGLVKRIRGVLYSNKDKMRKLLNEETIYLGDGVKGELKRGPD